MNCEIIVNKKQEYSYRINTNVLVEGFKTFEDAKEHSVDFERVLTKIIKRNADFKRRK